jgi:hypothetical protein
MDAFKSCWSLTSVNIPHSCVFIGDGAFSFCKGLLSLELPSGIHTIGNGIIEGCHSLESIIVNPNNNIYASANSNCIIEKKGNILIAGCCKTKIPLSTEVIGNSAFKNCTNLIDIIIPQGVKTIEIDAFRYCTNLHKLHFPPSVTRIGSYAFSECKKITSISISSRKIK